MFISLKYLKSIFERLDAAMMNALNRGKEEKERKRIKVEFIKLIEECKSICVQDPTVYSQLELEDVTIAFNVTPILIKAECQVIYINEGIKQIKIGLRKKLHVPAEILVQRIQKGRDIGSLDDLPRELLLFLL
jgi:hypothetical protein